MVGGSVVWLGRGRRGPKEQETYGIRLTNLCKRSGGLGRGTGPNAMDYHCLDLTFGAHAKMEHHINRTPCLRALPLRMLRYYHSCNQGGCKWALVEYIPLKTVYSYYTLADASTIKLIFPDNRLGLAKNFKIPITTLKVQSSSSFLTITLGGTP